MLFRNGLFFIYFSSSIRSRAAAHFMGGISRIHPVMHLSFYMAAISYSASTFGTQTPLEPRIADTLVTQAFPSRFLFLGRHARISFSETL